MKIEKSIIFVQKKQKKKEEKMKIDMRKIKNFEKLEIVVIIQGNIVVLHIAFVT